MVAKFNKLKFLKLLLRVLNTDLLTFVYKEKGSDISSIAVVKIVSPWARWCARGEVPGISRGDWKRGSGKRGTT